MTEIEDDISKIDDQIHTLGLSISAKQREADLQIAGLEQARWELRQENTIASLDLRQSRLLKETDIRSLTERVSALEIVAPADGVIHSVGFPNAGEVIDRGETLFELLPTGEALIAVLRLPTREVGHVSTGMGVKLRLETFDARTTLPLEGQVLSISPNRVFDRDLGTDYFRATVMLDEESRAFEMLEDDLSAGMVVTAEIVTRYRSLLSYIMKPVERSVRMAFGER
ncbi:MAG: HlyD family efflux transporter periplasmic adaptor subunit [Planctomycetota bacterium]